MATNRNDTALKDFVDRVVNIEKEYLDAKAERGDLIKDIKVEIKQGYDANGVEWKEVDRLVKIRLEEQAAREKARELDCDLETYEVLYGPASAVVDKDDDV